MIVLNEKVKALIDLLELETEHNESYTTIFFDKDARMCIDITEKDDIKSVKKRMFNELYREGRHGYKYTFIENLYNQLDDLDGFVWDLVYEYKNPF